MKLLTHFFASLFVAAVCTTTLTIVCDHTIFNSHYLQQKAAQTNTYAQLSSALSAQLARQSGDSTQVQSIVQKQLLTPAVLQQKVNSAFDELQAFYKGNGQLPMIDLSPYIAQAKSAGVQLPANTQLNQPLTLVKGNQTQGLGKQIASINTASIIALLPLTVLLILFSIQQRRYTILPNAIIVAGVFLGIGAVLFIVLPDLVNKYLPLSFSNNALASIARNLIDAITHDMGRILGIIAGVMVLLGVIAHIVLARFQPSPILSPGQSPKVLR